MPPYYQGASTLPDFSTLIIAIFMFHSFVYASYINMFYKYTSFLNYVQAVLM